jgi:hypothetical protein
VSPRSFERSQWHLVIQPMETTHTTLLFPQCRHSTHSLLRFQGSQDEPLPPAFSLPAQHQVQMDAGVTPGLSPAFGHEITLYVPPVVRIRHLSKRTMYLKCSKNAGILDCHKSYRKESLPILFDSYPVRRHCG